MRCALEFTFPVEKFNAMLRDGSASKKMQAIVEEQKPEAIYFWAKDGKRGGVMFFDMPDAAQIPAIAEPWMLTFDAAISLQPCMTPEDFAKTGIDELGKKWG